MPDIEIKLEAFEGPLDLLLKLIEKNEIDIYDIPIALLADQYLYHLDKLLRESGDSLSQGMRSISEFLVLAAQLLEIKSRLLLPAAEKEADAEDPRDALARRLADYRQCKALSDALGALADAGLKPVFRSEKEGVLGAPFMPEEIDIGRLLGGLTAGRLFAIYRDVLNRREMAVDRAHAGFGSVRLDLYTVEEKIDYIRQMLSTGERFAFSALFAVRSPKEERVVTFLAVLELAHQRDLNIEQQRTFGEIRISRLEAGEKKRG